MLSHQDIDNQYYHGCRHHDEGVDLELVAGLTALCLGGNDGGVADKRQVVAEK